MIVATNQMCVTYHWSISFFYYSTGS